MPSSKIVCCSTLVLLLLSSAAQTSEKLQFVIEINRHGARAGLRDEILVDLEGNPIYTVPNGMLTPQGMRQRYLLGKMNRQKYVYGLEGNENLKLLNEEYIPQQIYIQSTNRKRTMQSGYSELLGFFPPNTEKNILSEGEVDSLRSGKGLPPFSIKNIDEVMGELGQMPIVDAHTQVPLMTYSESTLEDELDYDACPYTHDAQNYFKDEPSTWEIEMNYYFKDLKKPIMEGFGYSEVYYDSLDFEVFQKHTDEIICESFENFERYDYLPRHWSEVNLNNKADLIKAFKLGSQELFVSRIFNTPLIKLQERLQKVYNEKDSIEDLRYFMYSSHDTQVANILEVLFQGNYDWQQVPFASHIYLEAYQNLECTEEYESDAEKAMLECTKIKIIFNGEEMKINYCAERNQEIGNDDDTYCKYGDFLDYYSSIVVQGDLNEKCLEPFDP